VNINDAFPSNYIKASDLGDVQPVVSIDRVEVEPVGRTKEMKPVIYFVGKEKGMVLNKTNSKKIAEIAGSGDTDDWHGVEVKLFATEVDFQGETVEAIRVKAPTQAGRRPAARPEPVAAAKDLTDDDIPFAWLLPIVLPLLGAGALLA
jgi:hypothetical protein